MMELNRKWYSEIVLLHCLGMLMILITHISYENGYNIIGEVLASGVPLFLCVSGFLVGVKPNLHNMSWLAKKAKRVLVPYYILLGVVLIAYLIVSTEKFQWKQWLILFADMQGLTNFVFYNDITGFYSPLSQGLGHFWFVTVIMLCYLIVPVFENICKFQFWKRYQLTIIIFVFFILQPILIFYNVRISSFVCFFIGYMCGKNRIGISGKRFFVVTLLSILLILCRLLSRRFIDETIIYNLFIASISNIAIGLWIVALIFYLRTLKPRYIDTIATWKIVVWMESIIYEVYLIHHIIIKGSWSFYHWGLPTWITTILVLMVTIILSLLLKFVSKLVSSIKFINSNINTHELEKSLNINNH